MSAADDFSVANDSGRRHARCHGAALGRVPVPVIAARGSRGDAEIRLLVHQVVASIGSVPEGSTRIDLPSVHVPSASSRAPEALCNSRNNLIEARTKLVNYVRGQLCQRAWVAVAMQTVCHLGAKVGRYPRESRLLEHAAGQDGCVMDDAPWFQNRHVFVSEL